MKEIDLTKIGLTPAESLVYQTILKTGKCTANKIAENSGFHRTNIYDILKQLVNKGLVVQYKEENTTRYKISDPKNLYNLINEKEDFLNNIFPTILGLAGEKDEDVDVEVYKGKEGMKSAFNDQIREGKTIYAFGVKGQLREELPIYALQYIRQLKEKKIKYYGIYTDNPPNYFTEIRFIDKKLSGPVATHIYGDKICINIWKPKLIAIIIKSKQISKMYKDHFDLLWNIAEKK